jgi:dTDP-3-amino-2,3,6-trideoxy-4-keto-D-glucose/dTDP-3-amino-3,4,6-trideoxy-alpha-D-glucose/dTDP-2,6-dideoxy-D-kanosamine transaminase
MSRKIARFRPQIDAAIKSVLDSSNFVLGKHVETFEKRFAEYIGANYCRGVANGTDALELCLRALQLEPKSYVMTVANAGNYSSTAILASGHIPIFVDVDSKTLNISLENILRVDPRGISALIVTHLYGQPVQRIKEIQDYCKENSIYLVEDCAQSHGARIEGKTTGSFGDLAAFSFYPTKNLGGIGDGGAITTDDKIFVSRIEKLRNYGWGVKYQIDLEDGRNSRLDEIQASVLTSLLNTLDQGNRRRIEIAKRYRNEIRNKLIVFPEVNENSVYHLFIILTDFRDALQLHLGNQKIDSAIHYPVVDSQQIGRHSEKEAALVNTLAQAKRILTIPCHPEMTDEEITRTIQALNCFTKMD